MAGRGRCQSDRLLVLAAMAGSALVGCNRLRDRAENAAKSAAYSAAGSLRPGTPPSNAPAPAAVEPDVTPATLTVHDVELYQQSINNRIDMVKRGREQQKQAKTAMDSIRALAMMSADADDSAVARSGGVTVEHLKGVSKVLGDVLINWQMQGLTSNLGSQMDTTNAPPAARAKIREVLAQAKRNTDSSMAQATAGMTPDVVATLQQRRPALDSARAQLQALVFGAPRQ